MMKKHKYIFRISHFYEHWKHWHVSGGGPMVSPIPSVAESVLITGGTTKLSFQEEQILNILSAAV